MAPILVVGADAATADALARVLGARHHDHPVEAASDGTAALARCREHAAAGASVALVIAAEALPGGAAAFLRAAHALQPDAGRVLLAAHADALRRIDDAAVDGCLVAPWADADRDVHPVVDALLADHRERARFAPTLVREVMRTDPACIAPAATLAEAAAVVADTLVPDLMVVDVRGDLVGVLSEGDLLRSALPDPDAIAAAGGTPHDGYQAFLRRAAALADKPIDRLVITEPFVLAPEDHVARAATLLVERQIRLLPVVAGRRLVGTLSRADLCRAVVAAR